MERRVLTSVPMERSCGQVVWTILSARGISGKVVSYSSMISVHRSSPWVTVQLVRMA